MIKPSKQISKFYTCTLWKTRINDFLLYFDRMFVRAILTGG